MRVAPEELHSGCIGPNPPASWSFTGPTVGLPLNCPGISSYTVDLKRHPEPVSFPTRDPMPFGSVVFHSPGQIYLCSEFSPEKAISSSFPGHWLRKPGY